MFSKLSWIKGLRGAELNDPEFRVLVMLSTWTDREGNGAYPGKVQLADACNMQPRSIVRILQRLETKGWIMQTFQGGNQVGKGLANAYALRAPSIIKGDPPGHKGDPPGPFKGDPPGPFKGDSPVTPSGPFHQGHASGPDHHSEFVPHSGPSSLDQREKSHGDENGADLWSVAATSKSAEQQDEPRVPPPDWEAMREEFEVFEEYLESLGLDTLRHGALISARWENGDHPKAIAHHVFKESWQAA